MDQCASRLSTAVRRKDIHTRAELVAEITKAYPGVVIERILQVADTTGFLNPGRLRMWKNSKFRYPSMMSNHRFFRFSVSAAGQLEMRTKDECEQTHWSSPWLMLKEPTKKSGDLFYFCVCVCWFFYCVLIAVPFIPRPRP